MERIRKLQHFFALLLWPFSLAYACIFSLYRVFHGIGVLHTERFATAVLSVGNITMGGTGKTPFVIYLTHLLSTMNRATAVVSRGYGRPSSGGIIDLEREPRAEGGDEPWLIAAKTTAPVIVCDKKYRGCGYAIETYQPDAVILDDGFQSFSIWRDMDIVLIDASDTMLSPLLIPAGTYREHLSAVRRADAVILTRSNQVNAERLNALTRSIRNLNGTFEIFRASHEVRGLVQTPGDEPRDSSVLKGKRIIAVSAIGNNRSFLHSLFSLRLNVVYSRSYLDHHRYTPKDVAAIKSMVTTHAAEAIVTTEKDLYTLHSFRFSLPVPLYALSIMLKLDDRERFIECFRRKGIL